MTTGKTLEEAKYDAAMAGMFAKVNGVTDWNLAVDKIISSFAQSGFVLCNQQLTVAQRTAAHNALTLHKYEIQPAFDAILAGVPK
jgi:hypothetical protein